MKASDQLLSTRDLALYDSKNDRFMKHPASQIFKDHSSSFLEFAKQLGLTFASRARTAAPRQKTGSSDNPFDSSTG